MIKTIFRHLLLSLVPAALLVVPVWASDADAPLKAWQGEYVSMSALIQGEAFGPVYDTIAQAAVKMGKAYTPEKVKAAHSKMYETDFGRVTITENQVAYYPETGADSTITVTYVSKGAKEAEFGQHTFTWHLFEAESPDAGAAPYRFLIATEKHAHEGGQPHCHLRYGQTGFDDLMNNVQYKDWWPTLVEPDFDTTHFIKGLNPKMMAKMLP